MTCRSTHERTTNCPFLAISAVTAIALAAAIERPARADIVNVQSAISTNSEDGLSGSITGSIDWRTGNRPRLLFSLAPVIRYRTGKHRIIGLASGDYLRNTDDLKIFEHVRYRYQFSARWLAEVFAQHEYNEKRLVLLRALVGAGLRYQILDCKNKHIGLGVAYMTEYEVLEERAEFGPVPLEESPLLNHRISSYLTGSYDLDDRVQLTQTFYAQPLISDPGDIRLLSESALTFHVTKQLLFRSSLQFGYDSRPPVYGAIKPLDSMLTSAITFNF